MTTIGEYNPPPGRPDPSGRQGQGNQGSQGNQGNHGDPRPLDEHDRGHGREHDREPGEVVNVNWDNYDVPRIWPMVANEGNIDAEDLVWAFNKISQYVDDTRLRLIEAGKSLALAWSGAASSTAAQGLLTEVTDSMNKDATAYVTATRELEGIVTRLAESKKRIEPLYEQWQRLAQMPADAGMYTAIVVESDVYKSEVAYTNNAAREEMRRLDRDLTGARITTTEEFVPSTGVPSDGDLQLAGLGPQAIDAAHGGAEGGPGGMGKGLLSGGAHGGAGGAHGGPGGAVGPMAGPGRTSMPGVIGGDAATAGAGGRPMAGGMMGGGAHGGGGAGGGGGGGGKANTQWEAAHGVSPVIDGTPQPKSRDT